MNNIISAIGEGTTICKELQDFESNFKLDCVELILDTYKGNKSGLDYIIHAKLITYSHSVEEYYEIVHVLSCTNFYEALDYAREFNSKVNSKQVQSNRIIINEHAYSID